MTRQQKYPETKTFHYFNANPRGRVTTDCVIRALTVATGLDYRTVARALVEIQCDTGYDEMDKRTINAFLSSVGFEKLPQPRKEDNTKYTGYEMCRYLDKNYKAKSKKPEVVAMIGGHHIVCINYHETGYKVWDIWNSTDGCIGTWWIRKI